MIRKVLFSIFILINLTAIHSYCDELKKPDPNQLFYSGNSLYEKREYQKAVDEYLKIIEMGIESPGLYYNIGNCYFKMDSLGRAILFYEKAKRLAPQDADLKSNLAYAKSLVGNPSFELPKANIVARLIRRPFEDFNLNAIAISAMATYLIFVLMQSVFFINHLAAKRMRILYIVVAVFFIASVTAFGLRYYDEEILKHAVIVVKEVESKYEPIEKSMTYYKLQQGDEAIVLKARSGWSQIERPDEKIGWVPENAVEEI